MGKTLYLHIGFDKTSTTAIQRALVINQAIGNLLKAFNHLSFFDFSVIMLKTKLGKYPLVPGLWRMFSVIVGRAN